MWNAKTYGNILQYLAIYNIDNCSYRCLKPIASFNNSVVYDL